MPRIKILSKKPGGEYGEDFTIISFQFLEPKEKVQNILLIESIKVDGINTGDYIDSSILGIKEIPEHRYINTIRVADTPENRDRLPEFD